MGLYGVLFLLVLVTCLVLAVSLIARGLRGTPEVSEPHCRRCRYELRQVLIAGSANCPECGADLGDRRAVAFGRSRRRPLLLVIGLGFIVMPLVVSMVIGLYVARVSTTAQSLSAGPGGLAAMTSAELAAAAEQNPSGPWFWSELDNRWVSGALTPEEAAAVIDGIMIGIDGDPTARGELKSWGGETLARLVQDPDLPEAARDRLAEALAPVPELEVPARMRSGSSRSVSVALDQTDLARGNDVLIAVHDLRMVGGDVDRRLESSASRRSGRPVDLPIRFTGTMSFSHQFALPEDVPPGRYELRADLEWAALLAEPALLDTFGRPRHPDRWPDAIVRHRTTMVKPIEVLDAEERLVEFLPPDESGAGAEAVRAALGRLGLKVTSAGSGRLEVALMRPPMTGPIAEAYCFDVIAVFGETEIGLGRLAGSEGAQSIGSLSQRVDALPPPGTSADVILRPAPNEADRLLGRLVGHPLPPIIGETIRFTDVPVDREDE